MKVVFPQGVSDLKGKKLKEQDLDKLLDYISRKSGIKYTAFLYDLSGGDDEWVNFHRNETVRKAKLTIEKMRDQLFPSYVKDIELYLNQLKKYSVGDYAKYVMYTEILLQWQQFFAFDYIFLSVKKDTWNMHHVLDTQNQPKKFIRLIQATMKLTANHLNPNYRIITPAEWPINHPYFKKYRYKGDINLHDANKFFEDFKIDDEQNNPVLLLPDAIGYVIYKSILNQHDEKWLHRLHKMKQNRSWALINKFKDPDGYYHITGFNRVKNPRDVLPLVKSHYVAMKRFV